VSPGALPFILVFVIFVWFLLTILGAGIAFSAGRRMTRPVLAGLAGTAVAATLIWILSFGMVAVLVTWSDTLEIPTRDWIEVAIGVPIVSVPAYPVLFFSAWFASADRDDARRTVARS
jgi:hypothetical protein